MLVERRNEVTCLDPALRTLVPYILGVLIAGFLPIPLFWIWLIALTCLIGGVGCSYVWSGDARAARLGWVFLLGAICACGMFRLKVVMTSSIPPDFYDQRVHFSGEMAYQPERGEHWGGWVCKWDCPERWRPQI